MDLSKLATPCARFIAAVNNQDSKSLVRLFVEDSVLVDESIHHLDRAAIRSWAEHSLISHHAVITKVLGVKVDDSATRRSMR